jgi:hypothetical protein
MVTPSSGGRLGSSYSMSRVSLHLCSAKPSKLSSTIPLTKFGLSITHCFESRGGILPLKLNIISSLRSSLRRLMVQAPFNGGLQQGADVPDGSTV